ncbi:MULTISPECIES: histidine phosphatase family protein [unclassified Cupriavidus]|uniref:histidine phosphatase family protein n=1 Tax=unclassified Cupriavidus TaxID=2640874 RepID=UPI00313C9072
MARLFPALFPALLSLMAPMPGAAQPSVTPGELQRPNVVVIVRHASAPGLSDPPGFRLGDCATQRNLDAAGRQQATDLGAAWKTAGFRPTRVMSSAWCRCQETARLMNFGPVRVEPLLNSFFEADDATRTAQTERLSRLIDGLDPRPLSDGHASGRDRRADRPWGSHRGRRGHRIARAGRTAPRAGAGLGIQENPLHCR